MIMKTNNIVNLKYVVLLFFYFYQILFPCQFIAKAYFLNHFAKNCFLLRCSQPFAQNPGVLNSNLFKLYSNRNLPYEEIPINKYKLTNSLECKIQEVKKISSTLRGLDLSDVYSIVINHGGKFKFVEGQNVGIIPLGLSSTTGKPHKPRLYSICSSRHGDTNDGQTFSLCVKHVVKRNTVGSENQLSNGTCSSYLCFAAPNQKVNIVGPMGKAMTLPPKDVKNLIFVCTGTGIAPFRGLLKALFNTETNLENASTVEMYVGCPTSENLLFKNELHELQNTFPKNFMLNCAFSREMTNSKGGKMYVQHLIEKNALDILGKVSKGNCIYFCGLKDMMNDILTMLKTFYENNIDDISKYGEQHGTELMDAKQLKFNELVERWKKENKWRIEVY